MADAAPSVTAANAFNDAFEDAFEDALDDALKDAPDEPPLPAHDLHLKPF